MRLKDLPPSVLAELAEYLDKKYPAPVPTPDKLGTEAGRLSLAEAQGCRRVIEDIRSVIKVQKRNGKA